MNRRNFLRLLGLVCAPMSLSNCALTSNKDAGLQEGQWVNDIHSQLNPTWVRGITRVNDIDEVRSLVKKANANGSTLSVCGARHAMGGQQFGTDSVLIDTSSLSRVLAFDRERGLVTVEAGIDWPQLIRFLIKSQKGSSNQWAINQKQTGADHLTIGGAVAANIHGRGLKMKPFIGDIESIHIMTADGELRECSRLKNSDLFRLAVGGYGLFGFVYSVTIRLARREKLERIVTLTTIDEVPELFAARIRDGFMYGDFQYAINERNDDFLRRGICACYRPVPFDTAIPEGQRELSESDRKKLIEYAHNDEDEAFQLYSEHYLATNGQIYWSDLSQLGPYFPNYHYGLDIWKTGALATEIISELYVPLEKLPEFMKEAASILRKRHADVIYGTVRLIARDDESYLAWAKKDYACIIFNLHTIHSPEGVAHIAESFRLLIDAAAQREGSYFLTYHKFARKDQVLACYPELPEFLRLKKYYDPKEIWISDWYRHYRAMFSSPFSSPPVPQGA